MPVPVLKQITVSSKSNPINRDLYTIVELDGAISFDTPTTSDIRVGDTITFDDLNAYLNLQQTSVQVVVKQ